jgi:hypothetical protein
MITIQPLIFLFFATDYTNSHRFFFTEYVMIITNYPRFRRGNNQSV